MLRKKVSVCLLSAALAASPIVGYVGAGSVLAAGDQVEINEKNFPDQRFRTYVTNQFDLDKNGSLSQYECDMVESINVSSEADSQTKLSSLQGIEFFTELKYLNCSYNKLTKLDLSKNKYLQQLNCADNQISSWNLKNCDELFDVNCSRNKFKTLDVSMLPELGFLDCSENLLSSLDVSANSKLTSLDASAISYAQRPEDQEEPEPGSKTNHISKLVLGNNPNLTTLLLNSNRLTTLDLSKYTKMEILDVYDNGMTSLTLGQQSNLRTLLASDNKFTSLDISGCPNLEYLFAAYNKLSTVALEKCPNLQEIELGDNQISSLDFSKNTKVKNLSVTSNKLSKVDLSMLSKLQGLYVSDNDLTELDVSHNKHLVWLGAGNNKLEKVDLGNNSMLDCIYLDTNKLTSIDLSKAVNVTAVGISGNRLTEVNVTALRRLSEFNCGSNRLSSLNVSNNPELNMLYCDHNLLTELDLSRNSKITALACGENYLKDIKISNLKDLDYLYVSGIAGITKLDLPKGAPLTGLSCMDMSLTELDVSGYPELRSLYCGGNKLTKLDLSNNPMIENLNCGGNLFKTLDVTCLPQLEYMALVNCSELTELKLENPKLDSLYVVKNPSLKSLDISKCETLYNYVKQYGIVESPDGRYFESRMPNEYDPDSIFTFFQIDQTLDLKGFELPKPNPGFEEFVERLYTKALNRASDPEGKKFWVDKVTNNEATGADCARFFLLDAPEFMARNLTNEDFLEILYTVFFDRESDPEGKAFYLNALKEGATKQYVVECFIESREWCDVCAEFGVKSGAKNPNGTKPSKQVVAFVHRLYSYCLDRDPDEEGLNYWSLALTNGQATGVQAARFFFGSKEMKEADLTDYSFIYRLYNTFFDREPEYDGMRYWEDQLAEGVSRDTVVDLFAISDEFAGICAKYGIVVGQL